MASPLPAPDVADATPPDVKGSKRTTICVTTANDNLRWLDALADLRAAHSPQPRDRNRSGTLDWVIEQLRLYADLIIAPDGTVRLSPHLPPSASEGGSTRRRA